MAFVFIAYADAKMAYSLKRIGRQARRLGIFDDVLLYTPDDLPQVLKDSPLMQYPYGGGYWAWKPWIIKDALEKHDDGDVVCYVDAGCTLNKSSEWNVYMELMKEKNSILFHYPPEMPVWEKYGGSSTKIKHWAKKKAVDYYDALTGGQDWRECLKVLGGFLWFKGKDNPVVDEWLDIVLNHPDVIDDSGVLEDQYDFFWRHKHDQPALTALSYKYREQCAVLPELLDEGPAGAAVVATRVRAAGLGDYCIICLKRVLKMVVGEKLIMKLKKN